MDHPHRAGKSDLLARLLSATIMCAILHNTPLEPM
jgi:hypothetical protein